MSFQTLILLGNLGRDPEMRYTPAGKAVTTFSLACNRTYTGEDGQKVDETAWFRVTVWGSQAENCNEYLHKGSSVLVEGRLTPDKNGGPHMFQKKDGTWGASFEVTASTVRFLDRKGEGEGTSEPQGEPAPAHSNGASQAPAAPAKEDSFEIPF